MKKTFLDLGMQPLANNFSKRYIPPEFRLKLKFDTSTKLVMINKHMKKEKRGKGARGKGKTGKRVKGEKGKKGKGAEGKGED